MAFNIPDEENEDNLLLNDESDNLLPDDSSEFPFLKSEDDNLVDEDKARAPKEMDAEDLASEADKVEPDELDSSLDEEEPPLKGMAGPETHKPQNTPPSQIDRYRQFLDEYKQLQNKRSNADLVNTLVAAGGKIGQSIAGRYSGQFNPDMSGVQMLQKMAERPVQDFEQKQVVGARQAQLGQAQDDIDPASPKSVLIRKYMKDKLGMDLPDTVSASDAQQLLKLVGKPASGSEHALQVPLVNQQTGAKVTGVWHPVQQKFTNLAGEPLGTEWIRDYRAQSFLDPMSKERLGFSGGTGRTTGTLTGPGVNRPGAPAPSKPGESVELNRNMLTTQQSHQLDQTRKAFLTEVKPDRAAINSSDRVIQVLESGQNVGDLPAEIQDQMARAFGQTGHITDAQMGRALGRSDWLSQAQLRWSMATQGKLDDENRQFLIDVMKTIRDQNQNFVNNKAKVYASTLSRDFGSSQNLKHANVTPMSIAPLLAIEEAQSSTGQGKKDPTVQQYADEHFKGNYQAAKAFIQEHRPDYKINETE